MAKRKPRGKASPRGGIDLGFLLKPEAIGTALVALAFLVLLSLLTSNRGALTGTLIDALRAAFGIGVWLVPLVFGALGLWLVLRQVSEQKFLSGRLIAGALILFLAIEGLAQLLGPGYPADEPAAEQLQSAGGFLGWFIGQVLAPILGLAASVGALFLIALAGLYVMSGLSFEQVQEGLARFLAWLRGGSPGPEGSPINPPLPLGRGRPFWQRAWESLFPPRRQPYDGLDYLPGSSANQPGPATGLPARTPFPAGREPGQGQAPAPRVVGQPPVASPPGVPPGAISKEPMRVAGVTGQTWRLPALAEILEESTDADIQSEDLRQRAQIIERTLEGFGVPVSVVEANQGPAVTQFGLRPGTIVRKNKKGEEKRVRVRVSQIQALSNDLSLALAASPLRIEAPVPGRDVVGVEVPNVQIAMVSLRGVMDSDEFRAMRGPLVFGLGRDVSGQSAVADLARMPHMLIAGATGSGKSVCVNAIITALLLTHTPDSLRILMIDPKRVELTVYNGIPHLLAPVVVDVERAVPVLSWATNEMQRRYKLFAKAGARNIEGYNEKLAARGDPILPYVVILIDELADLMLSAPDEVERQICRLAQMARATGMHLVIATQRPSVDVVTGLIKANFPSRIAFAVTSQVDSRVILDTPGAEQLLGRGDMLFMAPDASKLQRLQGCFVSDRETQRLVRYWKGIRTVDPGSIPNLPAAAGEPAPTLPAHVPDIDVPETATVVAEPPWLPGQETLQQPLWDDVRAAEEAAGGEDDMYRQAVGIVRESGKASVSLLQRKLRIGYSRAARLIDEMEKKGVVGPDMGPGRGREVLVGDLDEEQ